MQMFLATLLATAAVAAPTTGPASDVTAAGATLNGAVDAPAATVYFEYGTTTGYGLNTPVHAVPAQGPVSASVSGLTAETTYHYRIVADGVAGNDQTFTTAQNPRPPSVSSQRARDITPTTANATTSLNANGSATTYRVEYGTSTRYGTETAPVQATGTGISAISVPLRNLRPYTRYHWRFVATNAAGTTRGTNRSFRTARLPESVTLGVSRRTVPWGQDVRLGGRVIGAGVSGMTVELQAQRRGIDQDFRVADTARTGRDGGYLFTIPKLWTSTRYRVLTRTQVVATSPVATARSRVRVGIRARHFARKRARIQGSVLPGVTGTATLQIRRAGVGWQRVRDFALTPASETASRYRFTVRRVKRFARRFRVIAAPSSAEHVRGWSRSVKVGAQPRKKKRRG
jgi:hypothetical protein